MEHLYVEHQQKLCRLCLRIAESDKDLISVSDRVPNPADPKNKVSFAYILREVLTVRVNLLDAKICNLCVQQLQSTFVFKTQIEKSNDIRVKALKSKFGQTSQMKTVSPKRNGPHSTTRESIYLCDDSEESETDNDEEIGEEPATTRQSASKQSVITIETEPRPLYTRNIQRRNVSSSINIQNHKDAIVVLEKLDSLKNIFPCATCGRFFCTEISYLRHDFTCVHSCKTCKIDFKSELNFKAHFTKRHNLDLMDKHSQSPHHISASVPKFLLKVADPKPQTIFTAKATKSAETKQNFYDAKMKSNTCNTEGISKSLTTTRPARRLTIIQPMNTEESDHEDGLDAIDFVETEMDLPDEIANDTYENGDQEDGLEEIATSYTYDEFYKKFVQNVNDTTKLKCTSCDNEIKKHGMKLHIRFSHALKPTFFCELCPRSFIKPEQRMQHMKEVHTDDFKCELCDKQFFHSMAFKEHMLRDHSEFVDIPTLKKIEELDLPLEDIKFRENSLRSELQLRGRPAGIRLQDGKKRGEPVGPEEFTLERFKHNFIITSKSGKMQCSICSKELFRKTLMPHILEHHVLTKYIFCEICDEGFNSDGKCKEHMGKAHPGKQKCVLCEVPKQFTKESNLLKHMKLEHNLPNLKESDRVKKANLPVEELVFTDEHPNLTKMSGHCFEHVPDDIEMTKDQFYTKYIRTRKDDPTRGHCLACGLGFTESNRRNHLDNHHTISRQFACELCPSRFKLKAKLKNHMSSKHSQDYKCLMCDIQFLKCQQLIDHNKDEHGISLNIGPPMYHDLHPDEIKYVRVLENNIADEDHDKSRNVMEEDAVVEKIKIICQYCNEEFDSPRLHRLHLRLECKFINNGEEIEQKENEEYPCEFCGKIFTCSSSRNRHAVWHNKDSSQANLGPKSSKSKTKPKEMEYECDICNETSKGLKSYKHMKRCHKQEFRCGQCDNQSSTFLRLKVHIVKNHPRKIKLDMSQRHKCPHCFRYFAVADCLNDHIKTKHENSSCEDVINCAACEMRFDSESDQASHSLTYHHRMLQQLFDKETERDLAGAEEVYDEDQDSFFDQAENLNSTTQLRKRGRRDSSFSSSSSMTSATEISLNDEFTSPSTKKEKLDRDLIETSTAEAELPKHKCEICSEEFLFRPLYLNHMILFHQSQLDSSSTNRNHCKICNKDFKLAIILNRHNATVHGGRGGTQN